MKPPKPLSDRDRGALALWLIREASTIARSFMAIGTDRWDAPKNEREFRRVCRWAAALSGQPLKRVTQLAMLGR